MLNLLTRYGSRRSGGGVGGDVTSTDFSEYTTDAFPTGEWSLRLAATDRGDRVIAEDGATGGKVYRINRTTATLRYVAATWSVKGATFSDVEVLAKIKPATSGTRWGVALTLNSSNSNAYVGFMNGTTLRIERTSGISSASGLGSLGSQSWSAGEYYWVRFRREGDDLKLKWWAVSGSEPGSWALERSDANLSEGEIGLSPGYVNALDQVSVCDWFGYVTDGSTVPLP